MVSLSRTEIKLDLSISVLINWMLGFSYLSCWILKTCRACRCCSRRKASLPYSNTLRTESSSSNSIRLMNLIKLFNRLDLIVAGENNMMLNCVLIDIDLCFNHFDWCLFQPELLISDTLRSMSLLFASQGLFNIFRYPEDGIVGKHLFKEGNV